MDFIRPLIGAAIGGLVAITLAMPRSSQPASTTASPVTAATPDLSAPVTAATPDLSARITQSRIASDKYVDLLIVVDNESDRSFELTRWSCQFFNEGEPVGEDSFIVENVQQNRQTSAVRSTQKLFDKFNSTECRLIDKR